MLGAQHGSPARIRLTESPTVDELDAQICALARQMSMDTYRMLVLVAEFDDRFGWASWGFRNCAEWLSYRCDMSLSTAREHVRTAHALRSMPKIAAAFAEGRLSYSKVRAITRVVNEPHDEQALLDYALSVTAPQVEDRCREIRNVAPDSVTGALRAWQRRSLTLVRNAARGVVTINVELPLDQGELVEQALERALALGEAATGVEFAAEGVLSAARASRDSPSMEGNGWRAQRADALVAVVRAYLSGGVEWCDEVAAQGGVAREAGDEPSGCTDADRSAARAPYTGDERSAGDERDVSDEGDASEELDASKECSGSEARNDDRRERRRADNDVPPPAPDRYQIVVHVDQSALNGGVGRADLPIETVKRLACDGNIVTIVEDEKGNPLDVGRKRRVVTTALRRALWSRDRGCAFPGCRNRRWVEAHHIRHWADGGATSVENLVLLCSHHHTLLHEGGCGIRRTDDGAIRFVRGDGRWMPPCGYRLADMVDECVGGRDASVEGGGNSIDVDGRYSSMDVPHAPMEGGCCSMDARHASMERGGNSMDVGGASMEGDRGSRDVTHASMEGDRGSTDVTHASMEGGDCSTNAGDASAEGSGGVLTDRRTSVNGGDTSMDAYTFAGECDPMEVREARVCYVVRELVVRPGARSSRCVAGASAMARA